MHFNVSGSPVVKNSLFSGNTAADAGGGMFNSVGVTVEITNCIFDGNKVNGDVHSGRGGGLNLYGSGTVTNCTFSNNTADDLGGDPGEGGALFVISTSRVDNCVMWGNSSTGEGDQIFVRFDGDLTINFSDAEGGEAAVFVEAGGVLDWGTHNIDVDPKLASAGSGNLHIEPDSPCIDAADNTVAGLDGIETDLDGSERFLDDPTLPFDEDPGMVSPEHPFDIADMGAYEFQLCPGGSGTCPPDLDDDGVVGPADLAALLAAWGVSPGHAADFNCDALINPIDLATLLGAWGTCPP